MFTLRNLVKVACVLFSVAAGASNDPLGVIHLPRQIKFTHEIDGEKGPVVTYSITPTGQLKGVFNGVEKTIPTEGYVARELIPLDGKLWVTLSQEGNPDERLLFTLEPVTKGNWIERLSNVNGLEFGSMLVVSGVAIWGNPKIGAVVLGAVIVQQLYQFVTRRKNADKPLPIEAFVGPTQSLEGATLTVREVLIGPGRSISDVIVKDYAGHLYSLRTGLEYTGDCRSHIRLERRRSVGKDLT